MRGWSELADRVAATTRTSEKTSLLARYLAPLEEPELRAAATFLAGRPFAETDQRAMGLGWATIAAVVSNLASVPAGALGEAYDRSSDLGQAVAEVLRLRPEEPDAFAWPTLTEVSAAFAAMEAASGAAAKGAVLADLLRLCDCLTAKYVVKILTGELRIGLREGLLEAAIAAAFDRPQPAVSMALDAHRGHGRDRGSRHGRPAPRGAAPAHAPDQVHARFPGRGCRRHRRSPGANGLGGGQVRRHPRPAPPRRRRRAAVQPRPPRHQRSVSGDRRGGPEPGLGRNPRRRDPCLCRRPRAALPEAAGSTGPEGSRNLDPVGSAGDLRCLRSSGGWAAGGRLRCRIQRPARGERRVRQRDRVRGSGAAADRAARGASPAAGGSVPALRR